MHMKNTGTKTQGSGRPPTPTDRQAVPVRLERRHLRILDLIIREDAARAFAASLAVADNRASTDLPPGETYHVERRVHLATERRRLLGLIIDWYEAVRVAPAVKILAPNDNDDPATRKEIAEWIAREQERLTATAPTAVRIALAKRELRRMEREEPETLEQVLRAGRAATEGATDDRESD